MQLESIRKSGNYCKWSCIQNQPRQPIRHGHRAQWTLSQLGRGLGSPGSLTAEVRHGDCLLPVAAGAQGGRQADRDLLLIQEGRQTRGAEHSGQTRGQMSSSTLLKSLRCTSQAQGAQDTQDGQDQGSYVRVRVVDPGYGALSPSLYVPVSQRTPPPTPRAWVLVSAWLGSIRTRRYAACDKVMAA